MPDQEEVRKVIISWPKFAAAVGYEVCHGCEVDDAGVRRNTLGDVRHASLDNTCNMEPCLVFPAVPRGSNTFHIRAEIGPNDFTRWSTPRRYDVQDPGRIHDEL